MKNDEQKNAQDEQKRGTKKNELTCDKGKRKSWKKDKIKISKK